MSGLPQLPAVLCISGHDPTGGAGIQADIEAIASMGARAMTLISCETVQDSRNVQRLVPADPALLREQADLLLTDMRPDAVKIGLLGSAAVAGFVADLLETLPDIPVVLDPILRAGGGAELASDPLLACIRDRLLSHCHLVTPNRAEARRLSGAATTARAAGLLQEAGCSAALITGADETGSGQVHNELWQGERCCRFGWPLLAGHFHGSGCTLAAAAAARLAAGEGLLAAVTKAQQFTWNSLRRAVTPGHGQSFPVRRAP